MWLIIKVLSLRSVFSPDVYSICVRFDKYAFLYTVKIFMGAVTPFGTQGFGNHFGFVSDDEACALIRRAVDIGVNHFDSALCYDDSVRKLGLAIKNNVIKRDEVIISGRVCCHGREEIDCSADHAISGVEKQLEMLGMDYFDAMFIHDPGQIEPTLWKDGTFAGLLKAKSRGLVSNVGYGMRPHNFHLEAIETGDVETFNENFRIKA